MFFYLMPNGELVNLRHVVRIEPMSATQARFHFIFGAPAVYTLELTDLETVLARVKLYGGTRA